MEIRNASKNGPIKRSFIRNSTSVEDVIGEHYRLCKKSKEMVESKGKDYNRIQQQAGDTLFNLSVCKHLGVTDSICQGILVRLSDKFMRLCSLTRDPKADAAIKEEKVEDTICDMINYLVYLSLKYQRERVEKNPTT